MQTVEDRKLSTVQKGDALEDAFYEYLVAQKKSGKLVDGIYKPELCEIYKKKRYYCSEREADITFDVVVEIRREDAEGFALVIVFECKNYGGSLPENEITDFSDKLQRLFRHKAKGVLVCSSRLQSGAMKAVEKRGLGLIKFDQRGFEYIVQRQVGDLVGSKYLERDMFQGAANIKSMKFSAYCDGAFYGSPASLISSCLSDGVSIVTESQSVSLPYISQEGMEVLARNLLSEVLYQGGSVNLSEICDKLSLKLEYMAELCLDGEGNEILGEADFEARCIKIYPHSIRNRERFTIAHEIGHFYLGHGDYLCSESVVENDLFIDSKFGEESFYRNMEFQANSFASCLLLPQDTFLKKIYEVKNRHDIPTHRYPVYVDDQPCNIHDYNILMSELVNDFGVTKTAIEIRLRKLELLTDNREVSSGFMGRRS